MEPRHMIRSPKGQNNLAVLTGDHINELFFLQENVWPFWLVAKKNGRNNEMTVQSTLSYRTPVYDGQLVLVPIGLP